MLRITSFPIAQCCAVILAFFGGAIANAVAADAPTNVPSPPRQLSLAAKPWTGDFDAMIQRRMIRVLVPYSRTLFYNDKGRERGITAELVRDFERYVNQKYKTGKRPLTVYLIPTTRDKLLPALVDGLGDIAAGNLTVTQERQKSVDFIAQNDRTVREIAVTGLNGPALTNVDSLSGAIVHVREASSYYESLLALNERLRSAGKPPAILKIVPDALEDEDMMEMADGGLIDVLIVDDWKAKLWASVLPHIRLNDAISLRDNAQIGWGVRKESPKLAAAIADFHTSYAAKQGLYAYRLKRASQQIRQIKDPTQTSDWKRFQQLLALFRRYGERYGFDPIMLAAQGYQESQLNQEARSHVGAIGVMQLMPATGAQMKVGDISVTQNNIHAGAKYMDSLMSDYFPDARFSEGNRPLFAFASYNAGPGNISRMRKEAAKRGLDPDKWFNNVELVVAEKIGLETTTYVRNIYKYYVTYKLSLDAQDARQRAIQGLTADADRSPSAQ
jgi:membrane-bound lytic murein transglycosylase MltF